jgi:hypothetical protein
MKRTQSAMSNFIDLMYEGLEEKRVKVVTKQGGVFRGEFAYILMDANGYPLMVKLVGGATFNWTDVSVIIPERWNEND